MSFIVRCPFCKTEMECPDDVLGQVGQCVSCGREIDLEPVDGSPSCSGEVESAASSPLAAVRAAAIASSSLAVMPKITWEWAFDAVIKISIAVILIDGFLGAILWLIFSFIDQSTRRGYR